MCYFLLDTDCFFGVLIILFGSILFVVLIIVFSIIFQVLSSCLLFFCILFLISFEFLFIKYLDICVCKCLYRLTLKSSQFSYIAMPRFQTWFDACFPTMKTYCFI